METLLSLMLANFLYVVCNYVLKHVLKSYRYLEDYEEEPHRFSDTWGKLPRTRVNTFIYENIMS